jgi:hypothetical protein
MKLSFKLEHTDKTDVYRGFVFYTTEHEYGDVTCVHDIAEGCLADLNHWLVDKYSDVRYVRLDNGDLDEPDCLTVFEAAEAALGQ